MTDRFMFTAVTRLAIAAFIVWVFFARQPESHATTTYMPNGSEYWLALYRRSNLELLYAGVPGNPSRSMIVRAFRVKPGIPGFRPTPLPELLGRDYWTITGKYETPDDPEVSPYFLTLDIPISDEPPYGPVPYEECGGQCDWVLPGAFGLHGTGGNPDKLNDTDPGSSGCVRHRDSDIGYLYRMLTPESGGIRYYVYDP